MTTKRRTAPEMVTEGHELHRQLGSSKAERKSNKPYRPASYRHLSLNEFIFLKVDHDDDNDDDDENEDDQNEWVCVNEHERLLIQLYQRAVCSYAFLFVSCVQVILRVFASLCLHQSIDNGRC